MRRPFLYFTIPLILGVVFSYFINVNTYLVLFLLVLLILAYGIALKLNQSNFNILLIAFLLLGILLANFKLSNSQLIKHIDIPIKIRGSIIDIKNLSENESRYVLSVHNIYYDGVNFSIAEKAILKIIGEKKLEIGDELLFNGALKEPLTNTNPKLFNYKLSLLTEGIFVTTTIKESSILQVNKPKPSLRLRIKDNFIKKIEKTFDQNLTVKNSNIMKSIILGKYSYLEEEDLNRFRDLGLAHILAVSGLHIGIIAGVLILLFSYIGLHRNINIALTIGILWTYAYIIGNPPSVIRANLMFSLLLLSQALKEPYDSINILSFSGFLMIIINPFLVFSLGFQLSYFATFFILYLTPKLNILFNLKSEYIGKSMVGILAVQIGLFPIQAYYFNRIPILAIIANLLFIPLFSLCLILGMVLMLYPVTNGYISKSIGIILNFLLDIQFLGIEILGFFPKLTFRLPSPSIIEIILYYVLVFIVFGSIKITKLNKSLAKVIVFYLLLLIAINLFNLNLDQSLNIKFIDVGQGDSILIQTKSADYLIDTGGNIFGNFDIGKNILQPYLEKEGVFKLKGVFITHFDGDHCKSLPYLIDNIEIQNIYFGYERPGNIYYDEILEKAKYEGIPISILKAGDSLDLDDNTNITVYGPKEVLINNPKASENDLSLVLMLNYFNKDILFTGDIEKLGEKSLVDNLNRKVEFLKVPHHGSKTSSSIELLDAIEPSIGFISVGRNNNFGHPHVEVVERYINEGIELYRTDELGLINLILNRGNYNIVPFLKRDLSIIYILDHYGLWIIIAILYNIIFYFFIKYFTVLDKEMKKIELQGIY